MEQARILTRIVIANKLRAGSEYCEELYDNVIARQIGRKRQLVFSISRTRAVVIRVKRCRYRSNPGRHGSAVVFLHLSEFCYLATVSRPTSFRKRKRNIAMTDRAVDDLQPGKAADGWLSADDAHRLRDVLQRYARCTGIAKTRFLRRLLTAGSDPSLSYLTKTIFGRRSAKVVSHDTAE